MVTADDADGDIVLVLKESYLNLTCEDCTWVIDSAASFHIT